MSGPSFPVSPPWTCFGVRSTATGASWPIARSSRRIVTMSLPDDRDDDPPHLLPDRKIRALRVVPPRFLIATIWGGFGSGWDALADGMGLTAFPQGMYMLRWLKALVVSLFSRRSSLTLLSLQAPNAGEASRGRRRGPNPPQGPADPDSRVRAPRWHGPRGRSASIAVAEPDDDESVVAIGGLARLTYQSGHRARATTTAP